ncbi:MAG: hypothetical protein KF691_05515 [Phycisphaeraceae bacterium]|nr:hypothetical protein [Phycisphaeraceae bacterium]
MQAQCFVVGATLWLSMSAMGQVQYLTQTRSIKAQSAGLPAQTAAASDFGLFYASLQSIGTPETQSTGQAFAGQTSVLGPMQLRCSGSANPGKSVGYYSGYGTAFSKHNVTFSVPVDMPVNFISSASYANVGLTGPGVSFMHYTGNANENGTLLAGQTYTVYGETYGEIQFGNALPGSFSYILTLGVPPAAPASGFASPGSAVCPGAPVVLSVPQPPAGHVIDWYYNEVLIGTGAQITVHPPNVFSPAYLAQTRRLVDGAVSINRWAVTVSVNNASTPYAVQVNRNNLCQYDNGTIQLNAGVQYSGTFEWSAGSCDGPAIATGFNVTIPAPKVTTTYYVRIRNSCLTGACTSGTVYVRQCPGDFTCDGFVLDNDFVAFAAGYDVLVCSAPEMPSGCPADLNADGLVDDADFVLFASAYSTLVCP